MGEIADDHFDRMFDEMDRFESGWDYHEEGTRQPARRSFALRPPVSTLDDFDALPDDCSDLL